MADSRSRNASRNIVFAFANKIIAILLPFISRTIMLHLLGEEYVGVGSLFTSILSFLNLTELGVGAAIVYSMYKPIEEKDREKICAYLSYYRTLYRYIGGAMLLIGTVLLPAVPYLIKGEPPVGVNVYILFYLYLIDSVISYFFAGYRQSILVAHQRSDIKSKIVMIVSIFVQAGQIAALVLTRNFYVYAFVPILGTLVTNGLNAWVTMKKYPELKCAGKLPKEDRQALKKRLTGLVGTKMNSIVVHAADMIVISAFLGLTHTAMYGNYYYIMSAVNAFVVLIFSSMTASVGNSLITETKEKNMKLFSKIGFVNGWITGWCSVCMICLYNPFMRIWVGEELSYPFGVELGMVLYFFMFSIQRAIIVFKDAAGIWYEDRFRPYVCMIVNIVLNVILVQFCGVYGVILSSIAAFAISIPWISRTLFTTLFKESCKKQLCRIGFYALVTALAGGLSWYLCNLLPLGANRMGEFVWLIVRAVVCLIVPNVVFFLFYCRMEEFREALRMGKALLKRKKK
ncbi:MAG: polysaccharide biosynthesis protein [Lachnospiraceae bacterium]|nr:polysaccharide biosynthesis protein [Lachnospiraceae bacterium]